MGRKILSSKLLAIFILAGAWLWRSSSLFTENGLFPLTPDRFEEVFISLGGYRLILPDFFMSSFPSIVALLPLVLIALAYLIIRIFILKNYSFGPSLSFAIASAVVIFADPGQSLETLAMIVWSLLTLALLFPPQIAPLRFWGLINLLGLLALIIPGLREVFLWTLGCMSARELVQVLVIQRSKPMRPERRKPILHTALALGFAICLLSWLLFIPGEFYGLSIPQLWWLSFIPTSLCLLLSWFRPWQTKRWIGLASLSVGGLLFSQLSPMLILLSLFLCVELAAIIAEIKLKKPPVSLKILAHSFIFLVGLFSLWYFTKDFSNQRLLSTHWIALNKDTLSTDGKISVVGNAMPYLSFFYPGALIENPKVLLETEETEFLKWMDTNEVSSWIVDRDFLMQHWKELIENGFSPEKINHSVLSRLALYGGAALETKTMKLKAVTSLRPLPQGNSAFVVIKRTEN